MKSDILKVPYTKEDDETFVKLYKTYLDDSIEVIEDEPTTENFNMSIVSQEVDSLRTRFKQKLIWKFFWNFQWKPWI